MKKDINLTLIAVVVIIIAIFGFIGLGGFIGYRIASNNCPEILEPDTVRIETVDTCYIQSPPDTVTQTEVKYVQVPFYIYNTDTIVDSVLVPLLFGRHFAQLDDVADVWFSGYEAQIDSARTYKRTVTEFITQPYEIAKLPTMTAEIGAGAMYTNETVNPYLLGKVSYNTEKTTFSGFGMIDNRGQWGAGLNVTYRLTIFK